MIGVPLLELKSVGSVIDLDMHFVYPVLENGDIDWSSEVHIYDVSDEWFEGLDDYDMNLLLERGIYEILK